MKDIQKKVLRNAIDLISAMGCKYKIVTDDGQEFGDLKVVSLKPPRVRGKSTHALGELSGHIKQFFDVNSAVGAVQVIPCGKFDPSRIQSTVCAMANKAWGKDTYTSMRRADRVELMRTAVEAV